MKQMIKIRKMRTMIKLLPFEEKDFDRLISWIDNEELLIQFAGAVVFTYPLTKEQLLTYISDDKRFAFKVIDVKSNETTGHAEIYLVKPDISRLCRILIGKKEYRGKGIGQQIIQQLTDYSLGRFKVETVELNVYDWNIPAIKCYEKVGFKINTAVSSKTEVNGNAWASINMSIQRSEIMVIETDRLFLREMQQTDYHALCKILQDADVMYAYGGAFNDNEVQEWLDRQMGRYREFSFGLWAVILKETGEMIGQCGLTMQNYKDSQVLEVGYLFQKAFWHCGYATEAAIACRDYAFDKLKANEVFSIIRENNTASQNVAKRIGMTIKDRFIKHYREIDMPHYLYSVSNKKINASYIENVEV